MPTYLRPGVFVEETLQPLLDPASSGSEAVAAFVGASSNGGPLGPTRITSWSQFQALYGNIRSNRSDLAYGVYQYFNNGGNEAYVVRAANADATSATLTLNNSAEPGVGALKVTARAPGTWASAATSTSRIFVTVSAVTGGRFDLTVEVGDGTTLLSREQFLDLSLNPVDGRNAVAIVNSPTVGSTYVSVESLVTTFVDDATSNPEAATKVPLTGGTEGIGTPDLYVATQRLEDVDANLTLNLPGVTSTTVLSDVVNWADTRGNVFVVVDAPMPAANDTADDVATDAQALANALPQKSVAAVYAPWTYIADPGSAVSGAMRHVPPGAAVVGQYAYTDATRGVQKAPAGTATALKGVLNTSVRFSETALDNLNQAHVNVIRQVPGAGFCIMGARTLNRGMPDRYVNIRRSLIFLKRELVNQTRFAIFEENNDDLWESISATLEQYLLGQFQAGLFAGDEVSNAYFIKCDAENNDASAVNAGIVNVEVGVALASPAEFIVIRIGQFEGGSTVEVVDEAA